MAAWSLTVTLNAALDVSYGVDAVRPGESHRVRTVHQRAGGKGVNVARILHAMGEDVVVTGFVGGAARTELLTDLASAGIPTSLEPIAAESRRTVSVVSAETGQSTLFNEPGPVISDAEWASMVDRVGTLAGSARVVVLSGSLPPGVPLDGYAQLVTISRAAGALTVVDADGEVLRLALAGQPDVVKVNRAELAGAAGVSDPVAGTAWCLERGAGSVVVTAGQDGLEAWMPAGAWRAWLDQRLVPLNPTGAGDACAAAIAAGLATDRSWPAMLVDAVAWSAASVLSPVAGEVDARHLAEVIPWVRVEELDAARLVG